MLSNIDSIILFLQNNTILDNMQLSTVNINNNLTKTTSYFTASRFFPIIVISITSVAIFLDLFILTIVVRARAKLVPAEFVILIANNILCIVFKLVGLFKSTQMIVDLREQLGYVRCYIVYSQDLASFFAILAVLFYYSLFHISSVARNSITRLVFSFTHNSRVFLAYFLIVCVGFNLFMLVYSIVFRSSLFNKSRSSCIRNNLFTLVPTMTYLISLPIQIVYFLAIVFLVYSRLNAPRNNTTIGKTFRKNLMILVKFFVFSLLTLLISAPQYLETFMAYFFDQRFSSSFNLPADSGFLVFFSSQTLILTLIHNKLRGYLTKPILTRTATTETKATTCREYTDRKCTKRVQTVKISK